MNKNLRLNSAEQEINIEVSLILQGDYAVFWKLLQKGWGIYPVVLNLLDAVSSKATNDVRTALALSKDCWRYEDKVYAEQINEWIRAHCEHVEVGVPYLHVVKDCDLRKLAQTCNFTPQELLTCQFWDVLQASECWQELAEAKSVSYLEEIWPTLSGHLRTSLALFLASNGESKFLERVGQGRLILYCSDKSKEEMLDLLMSKKAYDFLIGCVEGDLDPDIHQWEINVVIPKLGMAPLSADQRKRFLKLPSLSDAQRRLYSQIRC